VYSIWIGIRIPNADPDPGEPNHRGSKTDNEIICTLNFAQVFEDNLMIYIIAGCVTGITLIIIIVIVISVRISRTKSTKKKPRQEFIREIRDGLQPVRLAHYFNKDDFRLGFMILHIQSLL
jgi:hypothetical protein